MSHGSDSSVTTILVDRGGRYSALTAEGRVISFGTFDCPRRPEDGPEIMRQRAEWLRRFPGARMVVR